jgi:hypothetical protein
VKRVQAQFAPQNEGQAFEVRYGQNIVDARLGEGEGFIFFLGVTEHDERELPVDGGQRGAAESVGAQNGVPFRRRQRRLEGFQGFDLFDARVQSACLQDFGQRWRISGRVVQQQDVKDWL